MRSRYTIRPQHRRAVATVVVVLAGLAAAVSGCSSGTHSADHSASPAASVLGAPYHDWVQANPPVTVGNVSGYGKAVVVEGKQVPEFTDVQQVDGRVVGWHMNIASGTHLGRAEQLVRAELPPDIRQTASWLGSFTDTASVAHCEFVNFQSAQLATSLGSSPPYASMANIGTSLYERTGQKEASASIATVNSAEVSTTAGVFGQSCPDLQ